MLRPANVAALLVTTTLLASFAPQAAAQTNTPAPGWRWGAAYPLVTNPGTTTAPPAPATPAVPVNPEADLFFKKYKQAAQFVQERSYQEAAIVMDVLSKSLTTSPWLEIALLRHCELNESRNDTVAMDDYTLLRQRLANAPYFQGDAEKARTFRAALQGAVDSGIDRIRVQRVRDALTQYHTRYAEYPESLAKLAILSYIDMENIHNANNQLFQYVATGQTLSTSHITYQMYEILDRIKPPEPFLVSSPSIMGTSLISDNPPKYAALVRAPGQADPLRVTEDQTIQNYFIAAIASGGVILCNYNRILVLPAPE